MTEKKKIDKLVPTHKERAITSPKTDLSGYHPTVIELVRFLARQAAKSDYTELLASMQRMGIDETASDED